MKLRDLLSVAAIGAVIALAGFQHPAVAQLLARSTVSFTFATSTTAARVEGSGSDELRYKAIRCWNNSATVVYLGDSDDIEYPICTDSASCPEAALTVESANVYAKSASGTPNLICITVK